MQALQENQPLDACLRRAQEALLSCLQQDANRRGEAKAWLISTLSQVQDVPGAARRACFDPCCSTAASGVDRRELGRPSSSSGRAPPQHSPLASCEPAQGQLLQLLAEAQPAEVGQLLLRDPRWVRGYLTHSPGRISAWFGHFDPGGGIQRFKFGARALANYALSRRAEVWQLLAWAGKHSQSPVAVAAKPHYFAELDVRATIANLARACPDFWESEELQRSCQEGEWLVLGPDAVSQELQRLLHDRHSSRTRSLQQLLSRFLANADWARLCQRLLPLLPAPELLRVTRILAAHQHPAPPAAPAPAAAGARAQAGNSLQRWLGAQAAFDARHAQASASLALGPEQSAGAAASTSAAVPAAPAAAAAAAAADLPCVTQLGLFVLAGCDQGTGADSSWSLEELLLANALTSHRSQLLLLLWQEEDAAGVLAAAVAAALQAGQAATCQVQSADAPETAAAAAAAASNGLSVYIATKPGRRAQRLLQLLLIAWLLRLHLLLDLSGTADAAAAAAAEQLVQQAAVQTHMRLPRGWICRLLPPDTLQPQPALPQPPEQQQQQTTPPSEAGQAARTPLRRGSLPAVSPTRTSSSSTDEDGRQGGSKRRSSKHKRHRKRSSKARSHGSTGSKKRRQRRRHAADQGGSSSQDGGDSNGDGAASNGQAHKRIRRRRRRRRGSGSNSSDDGSGSSSSWEGMDLDAGGHLLDPADFLQQHASPHAVRGGAGAPAAAAAAAAIQGPPCQQQAAAGSLQQPLGQQQEHQQQQLPPGQQALLQRPEVVSRLSSLAAGGRLWQRPCWLASGRVGGSSGSSSAGGRVLHIRGSTSEVADGLACYWLYTTLLQIAPRL